MAESITKGLIFALLYATSMFFMFGEKPGYQALICAAGYVMGERLYFYLKSRYKNN